MYASDAYNKESRQKKAKELREAAKKVLDRGLRTWKGEEDMLSMVRGDVRDMRIVAKHILANKLTEARNHASQMDTAARDHIPDSVYDWLFQRV